MSLRYSEHCDTLLLKPADTRSCESTMCATFFKAEIPSTYDAMTEMLDNAVHAMVEEHCIRPKDEPCMRLCLEEALVNAVRHGNRGEAHRKVSLEIAEADDVCIIRVGDEGNGFTPEQVPEPCCEQLGGRGIVLMQHYMDKVRYIKSENCLEMTFQRKAPCPLHKQPATRLPKSK